MRGKKTSIKDKQRVIEAKLKDPEKSLRDIQKETGVNHVTTKDILEEVPEILTSSNSGEQIVNTLDSIINDIAEMTSLSMKTFREKVLSKELSVSDIKQLNEIAKNNFDRKQLLTGKATSNVNILGDILKDIQGIE